MISLKSITLSLRGEDDQDMLLGIELPQRIQCGSYQGANRELMSIARQFQEGEYANYWCIWLWADDTAFQAPIAVKSSADEIPDNARDLMDYLLFRVGHKPDGMSARLYDVQYQRLAEEVRKKCERLVSGAYDIDGDRMARQRVDPRKPETDSLAPPTPGV